MRIQVTLCALLCLGGSAALAQSTIVVNTNNSISCTNQKGESGFNAIGYTFGGSNTTSISGGGDGAGKPDLSSLTIEKHMDVCSQQLIKAFLQGRRLPTLVLTQYRDRTSTPMLVVTLSEALVNEYQLSGNERKAATEFISFRFASICIASTPENSDGAAGEPVTVCYNVLKNTVS